MLFIKASKTLALGLVFLPLLGCAIATGLIFSALVQAVSYAPDIEEALFTYATVGFALVETFTFMLFFIAGFVYAI